MNQTGELRRQIEDMALQLVVGEPENSAQPSAWMPALERLSAIAAREHVDSVVSAVAILGETLRALSASGDPSAVSSVLQEGVAKLQQALESPVSQIPTQEMSLAQDPELMGDFIVESREHVVNIESQVLTLEREPFDSEALHAVFRGFHTRSEEHTSELQSPCNIVCRLLLEKKKKTSSPSILISTRCRAYVRLQ